ncbi:hypothetical protein [Actinomadura rudentiformis]|uniref:Uncharacterized protein n=1 Tax=Actinomadura rudentiformis TaxID=359158 RepID=A0A6H9YLA6_9ACTN|nr:hypothetical protein [Actinomadura rudentiformis]KAB2347998.1 hypothetical protein F8566_19185 [Actinomadura rudentiformis]
MSRSIRVAGALAAVSAASMIVAAPQASAGVTTAKVSADKGTVGVAAKARYRAEVMCKAKGRWGKGYVKTYGKPSSKTKTRILEWGYAIQRTKGNHKNSRVEAWSIFQEGTGRERWAGGPGYKIGATEDSKWHKGKLYNTNAYIGRGTQGQMYIAFVFEFDKGTGGSCTKRLYAKDLKWIG